ncbi:MAG TPA: hypothetical protein VN224_03680, partial [Xanthomonadales bacterium]|nr:hypothetical protein [Xanthomonadales bacterium]
MAQIADALTRLLYSVILVSLIGICLGEIYRVWFDHTLYIQPFKYNKDGQDASAAGLAFAGLIRAQQAALRALLRSGPNDTTQIFARPLDIRGVGIGRLDTSDLSDVKVEAQGVNITAVLSALRRSVSHPNEITGSISELGKDHYVYASWSGAPKSIRANADLTDRDAGRSRDLPSAAFAVSCRIVYAQLAPANPSVSDLTAEGFCSFARALTAFDSFLELRDGG